MGLRRVLFFMPPEPSDKRVSAFIDGQNLFFAAKLAFGYSYPNYDPLRLAECVVAKQENWQLVETFFYTGIPEQADDPNLNRFWANKLAVMGTRGVHTYSRGLRYRTRSILCPHNERFEWRFREEKSIDVRIALDSVRLARQRAIDIVLIFSQDQDLAEVAEEIRAISREQNRWIKIASAYPVGATTINRRGIDRTDWIRLDRADYESCIDPIDYRGQ